MDYIAFFELANGLKRNKRSGWVTRNVQGAESIADHSFRLALMAMVFAKKSGVNAERAVKMALVHDLPEAITGDISRDRIDDYENSLGVKPSISEAKKYEGEKEAMLEIVSKLEKGNAKEIFSLWSEFEERKTKTAKFVKELDSLECLFQALEYKRADPKNKPLEDFFNYSEKMKRINSPLIKGIAEKLAKEFREIDSG